MGSGNLRLFLAVKPEPSFLLVSGGLRLFEVG